MRAKLLALTSGYAIAAVLCICILRIPPITLSIVAALLGLLIAYLLIFHRFFKISENRHVPMALLFGMFGVILFALIFHFTDVNISARVAEYNGFEGKVTATVLDFDYEAGSMRAVRVRFSDDDIYLCKGVLYYKTSQSFTPGDVFVAYTTLRSPGGESSVRSEASYRSDGIFLTGVFYNEATILQKGKLNFFNAHKHLRAYTRDMCDKLFENSAPIMSALIYGDKSSFESDFTAAASDAGVSHLFAVSGMHLTFFVSIILFFGKKRPVYAIAILLIIVFMALTGFPPSVVRAGIMQIAAMLALLFRRESDSFTSMAISLFVILSINPYAIADIGLQFSYVSILGILTVGKTMQRNLSEKIKIKNKLAAFLINFLLSAFIMTVSAQIFTTPLTMLYFSKISLVAVLANICLIWLVSILTTFGMLLLLLASIWYAPAGLLAFAPIFGAKVLSQSITFFARMPFSTLGTQSLYIIAWVVFVYVISLLLYIYKPRYALFKGVAISFCALLIALAAEYLPAKGAYDLISLDVGQGQCIIIRGDGKTAVVDCHGDKYAASTLINALRTRNIGKIDLLILTRLYSFSSSGADELLKTGLVRAVVLPLYSGSEEFAAELVHLAEMTGTKVLPLNVDDVYKLGNMSFETFVPPVPSSYAKGQAAVLAHFGGATLMIPGSLPVESLEHLLKTRNIPPLTALAFSKNASDKQYKYYSDNFTKNLKAKYVIISGSDGTEPNDSFRELFGDDVLLTEHRGYISLRFKSGFILSR